MRLNSASAEASGGDQGRAVKGLYQGPIVDCDVHHTWSSDSEVVAYMTHEWQDYVASSGVRLFPGKVNHSHPGNADRRLDAFPPDGGQPGSDWRTTRSQLLDGSGVTRAIIGYNSGNEVAHPNPYFASELARAANDWTVENWLARDNRYYGKILVANHLPERAAAEVRRMAKHSRMVDVLEVADGVGQPFGHPVYHPIYEAAEESGLSVSIHIGSGYVFKGFLNAGGLPSTRIEYFTLLGQPIVHHLSSFITHGVFEKFPGLKLMLVECGVGWLPWALWGLDARYAELRKESSWVRRLPSEYFKEHVKVTTQPLELTPKREQLIEALEAVGGLENVLCFSTDYPHWDADDPFYVARRLPKEWMPKVFYRNACSFFGWTEADLEHEAASPAVASQ